MKTKRQTDREAKRLLQLCTVNGEVNDGRVHMVVDSILRSQPRGYSLLLTRFQRLLRNIYASRVAHIESAVPLTLDLRNQMQTRLTVRYGHGLTFLFLHNPALVGGVRIRVASDVYDGSVRLALTRLSKAFGLFNGNGLTQPPEAQQQP